MTQPTVWGPGTLLDANSVIKSQAFVATAGQTVFDLTAFSYALGTGALYVYINGLIQRPGVDFGETSATRFTLTSGAAEDSIVLAVGYTGVSGTTPDGTLPELTVTGLTASKPVGTDASKKLVSLNTTGNGSTLVTSDTPTISSPVLDAADNTGITTINSDGTTGHLKFVGVTSEPLGADGAGTIYSYSNVLRIRANLNGVQIIDDLNTIALMEITGAGVVTTPNNARFRASLSANATNATGDGTGYVLVANTEAFDKQGWYDNASGIITAGKTCLMNLGFSIELSNLAVGHTEVIIDIITSNATYRMVRSAAYAIAGASGNLGFGGSIPVDMDAADTAFAQVAVYNGAKTVTVNAASKFMGAVVG